MLEDGIFLAIIHSRVVKELRLIMIGNPFTDGVAL